VNGKASDSAAARSSGVEQLVVVLQILAVDLADGNRHIEISGRRGEKRCKFIMTETPI
jgi:hypothetical protein